MKAKTDTAPYKGHFLLYLLGLFVATALFAICTALAWHGRLPGWEYAWFTDIYDWPQGLAGAMVVVTAIGSAWTAAASVAAVFFARFYRLAGRLALSILMTYGIVAAAKHIVSRARPDELISGFGARASEGAMGFPSAHAAIATVITLTLLPYMPWKWRWIVPLVIIAVGISRLYLGVHLPLDVVGGVAVGTAVVALVRVLPQPLRVFLRID